MGRNQKTDKNQLNFENCFIYRPSIALVALDQILNNNATRQTRADVQLGVIGNGDFKIGDRVNKVLYGGKV